MGPEHRRQRPQVTKLQAACIPISLVGTFTILLVFGISLNNLSLFGLMLAVGIVVDDAASSISTGSLRIQTDCALIWSISAGH